MHEHPSNAAVLLLTSNSDTAHGLEDALMALEIACECCHDPVEVVARCAVEPPDLFVLDTRIVAEPEALGVLVNEIVSDRAHAQLRLVVLAHCDDIRYRLAAMRAGAEAFMLLADAPTALAAQMARIIGARDQTQAKVLVVDDQPVAALFAARVLEGAGMVTERVTDPMRVMDALKQFEPDLILMDLHMPGATGIELTGIIRGQERFADIAIIFLSAELDPSLQMAALRIGGDDFLSKPVAPDRLVAAVRARLERADARRRRWTSAAGRDRLTRFASREQLLERLDWLLGQSYSARHATDAHTLGGAGMGQRAIICLDITGDQESLELAAAEVAARISPDDLAARISERSIAVLVYRQTHAIIAQFAQHLTFSVGQILGERTMDADVGGGWYPLTGTCNDAATLLSRARKAARWSLRGGSDEAALYEHAKSGDDTAHRQSDVREAIEAERLELLYEPMVALTGIVGERYEVTPRLIIGDGELLAPADFLPFATDARLAGQFDRWLLRAGLDVLKGRLDAGEPVLLFIHQTLFGLSDSDWIDWVRDQINARDLIRLRPVLQFEISEADQQLELAIKRAHQLKGLGIRLCLNGIDFSELSMRVLHAVPSAYVRISRRVIHGPDAEAIAWLIQSIRACGARVIATGVDGPTAISRLFSAGVDLIQGPYVRPPGIAMDFEFAVGEVAEV